MTIQRRTLIKAGLGALASSAGLSPSLSAFAQQSGKTLIVIFQRGGADGLSMLVPYADDRYYALRPTVAIPRPGQPNGAVALDDYFGLHPSLAPLKAIHDNGQLAWMPSVHYPDGNQSHFESMEYIEQGVPHAQISSGWLNRYLTRYPGNGFRAGTFDSELDKALRGSAGAVTISNLKRFNLGVRGNDGVQLVSQLEKIYGAPPTIASANRRLTHSSGAIALEHLRLVQQLDVDGYTPESGAQYPDGNFGRRLRDIAMLIKAGVGIEIATTNIGGWDSHENQGGAEPGGDLSRSISELGAGIAAIHTDLGPEHMKNVLILTMTEFGRTMEENASQGTDHGEGACWFAVSGADNFVSGMHGEWPGLGEENLSDGRYLRTTVDYREVLAEALSRHLGADDLTTLIPDYSPTGLGLLT